jgi:ankyrin repeat protein
VIHKAASLGHAEILMLLLEMTGAKPDMPNSMQATPLHLACRNNRLDAARFLIGTGVDVNTQDEHGQVPLLICTIHGHYDLAKVIIDASVSGLLPEPIDIDLKDHRGLSPLNCAAIKGDFGMTKLLTINGNASVDQ